jgi:hypothetical protein
VEFTDKHIRHLIEDRIGDGRIDFPHVRQIQRVRRLTARAGYSRDEDVGIGGDPEHYLRA